MYAAHPARRGARIGRRRHISRRQTPIGVVKVMHRQPDLLELLMHCVRAAASRTFCTAGTSRRSESQ